eukprot:3335298-Pyramimonas_sp.AAC.1
MKRYLAAFSAWAAPSAARPARAVAFGRSPALCCPLRLGLFAPCGSWPAAASSPAWGLLTYRSPPTVR